MATKQHMLERAAEKLQGEMREKLQSKQGFSYSRLEKESYSICDSKMMRRRP